MKFCKKMLFVCTNKLCISQCKKLIRLTEMGKYTLPKAILEGFLICIANETHGNQYCDTIHASHGGGFKI